MAAYIARFATILSMAVGLRQLLAEFSLAPFPVTPSGIALLITSILATYFLIEFVRLLLHSEPAADWIVILIRHLDQLQKEDRHEAVVRYHSALSRLLWVEGHLRGRIEIGKRIARSAAVVNDKRTRMGALVDDLGWTYFALRELEEAKLNIERGIEIAESAHDHYWAAKGHRHLAGIAMDKNDAVVARDEFAKSREFAGRIEAEATRIEMFAGIDYGEAQLCMRTGKLKEALELVQASEVHRASIRDESRFVRIYALRGEIEEKIGARASASEYFSRGLREARKIGRIDEQIRCLQGLARQEKDPEAKRALESEASQLKAVTPITYDSR